MRYSAYSDIIRTHERALMRPGKLDKIMDAYNSPHDFSAVADIATKCDLSPLAAACLWSIERCISVRPSMKTGFNGRYSIAGCWALLSDKTGHNNNINEHRFQRWIRLQEDWEFFYQRTQEFLRLCKLSGFSFSRQSLFDAVVQRDITLKSYEDGTYIKMPKMELFNIKMMAEYLDASKLH